jgi:ABC-type transport system involved in multi-copper enzyme maturation permease subunit
MLWCKAWHESRGRFLLMLAFFAAFIIVTFLRGSRSSHRIGTEQIYFDFYIRWVPILFFIFVPPLLGASSLLQERSYGTAGLSLSLPVSRSRLVCARIGLGMLEFTALCLVPAILIPAMSLIEGSSYPVSAAFHLAILWIVCGAALLAASFLLSTVLAGQCTGLAASVVAILTYYYVTDGWPFFRVFNMAPIIIGLNTARPGTAPNGLPEAFPLLNLSIIATVALALFVTAIEMTRRQDF